MCCCSLWRQQNNEQVSDFQRGQSLHGWPTFSDQQSLVDRRLSIILFWQCEKKLPIGAHPALRNIIMFSYRVPRRLLLVANSCCSMTHLCTQWGLAAVPHSPRTTRRYKYTVSTNRLQICRRRRRRHLSGPRLWNLSWSPRGNLWTQDDLWTPRCDQALWHHTHFATLSFKAVKPKFCKTKFGAILGPL